MTYEQFCNDVESTARAWTHNAINFREIPLPWADHYRAATDQPIAAMDIAAWARVIIQEAKDHINAIKVF